MQQSSTYSFVVKSDKGVTKTDITTNNNNNKAPSAVQNTGSVTVINEQHVVHHVHYHTAAAPKTPRTPATTTRPAPSQPSFRFDIPPNTTSFAITINNNSNNVVGPNENSRTGSTTIVGVSSETHIDSDEGDSNNSYQPM